jgi:hypothetical protein
MSGVERPHRKEEMWPMNDSRGLDVCVFAANQLHDDRGKREDDNHQGEHGKVAENFAEDVEEFGKCSTGENFTDRRFAVALDGVFGQGK